VEIDDDIIDPGPGEMGYRVFQKRLSADGQHRLGQVFGKILHPGAEPGAKYHRRG
jgi:hypothetical protein